MQAKLHPMARSIPEYLGRVYELKKPLLICFSLRIVYRCELAWIESAGEEAFVLYNCFMFGLCREDIM